MARPATAKNLNAKELAVLQALQRRRAKGATIAELAADCFPREGASRSNSWVRNSLRRSLSAEGHVQRVESGHYVVGGGAERSASTADGASTTRGQLVVAEEVAKKARAVPPIGARLGGVNTASPPVPRIESVKVQRYRALENIELRDITPLTVFLGPNGSGKSTIFDVFAFLSECFSVGLTKAWNKRGRFKELRTRGTEGPIVIELQYREGPKTPLITYHLSIDEVPGGPVVSSEWLQWKRGRYGRPFKFLDFAQGEGRVMSGDAPDEKTELVAERLDSPDLLAVSTLGQLAKHPRVGALRRFITSWYLSYLSADSTRSTTDAGPQERLSQSGDNLPNVIQYLKERHGEQLERILSVLTRRVPKLERVTAEPMQDGRLLLQIKDAPFDQPILAKYASDGTLKLLAYLMVLYDPEPPQLVGIEEPENFLHPKLLPELAEECRNASAHTQLLVTSHSPFFVNALKPEELRVLYRDQRGYTQAMRVADMLRATKMFEAGGKLGHLWMEGFFDVGDPLVNQGGPVRRTDVVGRPTGERKHRPAGKRR